MTAEEYRRYLDADFDDMPLEKMEDLRSYKPDMKKSVDERRKSFLDTVVNPYLVRIGDMKIKVRFANNGVSIEQAFENMLLNA